MSKLGQDFEQLKAKVIEMGALTEQMVGWASDALITRDKSAVAKVLAAEDELDRFQIGIDSEAVRLITIYTPTAKDLRFLLMVVRINTELERVGDQAVNNCEYVDMFLAEPPPRPLNDLARMTEIACEMVHGALQAFAHEDVQKAKQVMAMDDAVDALNRRTFEDLLGDRIDSPDLLKRCMSLVLVAQSIERIADHAVNVCEEVVYLVKGEDIRHQT
ncbi:MAG: phosphate signaling complex protein PhoU [Vicinamibacterales bacterium]